MLNVDTARPREGAPEAVQAYLDERALTPAFDWRDVWQEEHARAFTVAKITAADVLADVQQSLRDALASGETYESWRGRITEVLGEHGWAGPLEVEDPETGEVAETNLTSPRRLRTIWASNIRTARAAGQWDRAQRTKRLVPFFIYQLGPAENHRPAHVALEGTILPVDHAFWEQWYPPNGWGCVCWLRQITAAEAGRLGGVSPDPAISDVAFTNARTGETGRTPQGIDPGWASNPGLARDRLLESRLDESTRRRD